MERETGDVAVRLANFLPVAVPKDLTSDGTGGILDQRKVMPTRQRQQCAEVAGHSDLVDAEDGFRPRCDSRLYECGDHIEGPRIDVHKHRNGPAIPHAVGSRNIGVADRDHVITWLDAGNEKSQMKGRCATRNGASVAGAYVGGKLVFKSCD